MFTPFRVGVILLFAIVVISILVGILTLAIKQKRFDSEQNIGFVPSIPRIVELPQPNAIGWKMYRNEQLQYEIAYPPDWLAFDSTESAPSGLLQEYNVRPDFSKLGFPRTLGGIQINVSPGDMNSYEETHTGFDQKENVVINGYDAIKFKFIEPYPILYAIEHKARVFVIAVSVPLEYDTGITEDQVNQVLSTFQFINE